MDSKINVYVVTYDEDIDKVFDSYQKADEYIKNEHPTAVLMQYDYIDGYDNPNDFDCTWWRYEADNTTNCIWIQKFEVE